MSEHIKEPWSVFGDEIKPLEIIGRIGSETMSVCRMTNGGRGEANRIAECVNYCTGISAERMASDMEQGVNAKDQIEAYDIVRKQRDELLAALKYARTNGIFASTVIMSLDAAIAKAEAK
jgi:hypothetical protein